MATLTTLPTWYVASNGLDITQWMIDFDIRMGRQHEIDRTESSTLSMTLDNRSGTFTPWNTNTYTFSASNSNFAGVAALSIEVIVATGSQVTYFWASNNADPVTGAQQGGIFANYAQMVGNSVTISGFSTTGYNGTFTVVSSTPSSFTVANTTTGTPATYGKVTSVTLTGCPITTNSLIEIGGIYPPTTGTWSQQFSGYANVIQPSAPDELNSQTTVQANDYLKTFAARLLSNSDIYPNFTQAAWDSTALTNTTQLYAPVAVGATVGYVYSTATLSGTASIRIIDGANSEVVSGTWGTSVTLGSGKLYPLTVSAGFAKAHGSGCFVGTNYSTTSPAVFYRGNDTSGITATDFLNNLSGSYLGTVNYTTTGAHLYDAAGSIGLNSQGWIQGLVGSLSGGATSTWSSHFWVKAPSVGDTLLSVYDTTNNRVAALTVNASGSLNLSIGAPSALTATLLNGPITNSATTIITTYTAGFPSSGTLSATGSAGTMTFTYTGVTKSTYTIYPNIVVPCLIFSGVSSSSAGTAQNGTTITLGATPYTPALSTATTNILDGNWHHVLIDYAPATSAIAIDVDGVSVKTGTSPTTVLASQAYWGAAVISTGNPANPSGASNGTFADMFFVQSSPGLASAAATLYKIGTLLSVQKYVGLKIIDALTVAQFPGSTAGIVQGYTQCVGDTSAVNQSNVLDYILNHVDTEQGFFFQSPSGALTFLDRFYVQETPAKQLSGSAVTIGDSGALQAFYEPGVEILQDDLDVWNRAQVTTYAGSVYETGNSNSVALYGSRTIPKTSVYTVTTNDTNALAQMLLYRYAYPQVRASKVDLSTKANANTPVMISLNLWDQITFSRHGSGNSAFQKQMVVESIEHNFVADPGEMNTTLVLSPFELVTGSSTPDSGSVFRFSDGTHTYSHFATTSLSTTFSSGAPTNTTINATGLTPTSTTITVASTTGFASSGTFAVACSGQNVVMGYTGTTSTTFTGCYPISGSVDSSFASGAKVTAPFTMTVASTTGFPTSGYLTVNYSAGTSITLTYTGTTSTTFTGCQVFLGTYATISGTVYSGNAQSTTQDHFGG